MHFVAQRALKFLALLAALAAGAAAASAQGRLVKVTAGSDGKFVVAGQRKPVIVAKPGESLLLLMTSKASDTPQADGTVHTFTAPAMGLDVRLKEGTRKIAFKAPKKPGMYAIVCLTPCGKGHDSMVMKLHVK